MSDTPKFEVIDRRRMKAMQEEEASQQQQPASTPAPEQQNPPSAQEPAANLGPRLVSTPPNSEAKPEPTEEAAAAEPANSQAQPGPQSELSPEDVERVFTSYKSASERIEDLIRAQNPAAGPQPPVTLENLIQQLYLSAMIQMGAGTQPGERPRIDILGARSIIEILGVLAEKTKGTLTEAEDRMLQAVLFEVRSVFLELASMVSLPNMQQPMTPPPGGLR